MKIIYTFLGLAVFASLAAFHGHCDFQFLQDQEREERKGRQVQREIIYHSWNFLSLFFICYTILLGIYPNNDSFSLEGLMHSLETPNMESFTLHAVIWPWAVQSPADCF